MSVCPSITVCGVSSKERLVSLRSDHTSTPFFALHDTSSCGNKKKEHNK